MSVLIKPHLENKIVRDIFPIILDNALSGKLRIFEPWSLINNVYEMHNSKSQRTIADAKDYLGESSRTISVKDTITGKINEFEIKKTYNPKELCSFRFIGTGSVQFIK